MNFSEIINALAEVGKAQSLKFERIVIALLKKYLEDQNKQIFLNPRFINNNIEFDGLVIGGIGDLESDTVVETIFSRNIHLVRVLIDSFFKESSAITRYT
jgi:hypothetical protein